MAKSVYRKIKVNVGDVFNNLTVLGGESRNNAGHVMYLCRCICGTKKHIRRGNLGVVVGCGCVRKRGVDRSARPTRIINIGDVFHDWTVLSVSSKLDDKGEAYFNCQCKCGTKRPVRKSSLGKAQGCGCIRKKEAAIVVSKTPTRNPEPETKKQKKVRQKKVVDTLESLAELGGSDEMSYSIPKSGKGSKARQQVESLLEERRLARELAELELDYDI